MAALFPSAPASPDCAHGEEGGGGRAVTPILALNGLNGGRRFFAMQSDAICTPRFADSQKILHRGHRPYMTHVRRGVCVAARPCKPLQMRSGCLYLPSNGNRAESWIASARCVNDVRLVFLFAAQSLQQPVRGTTLVECRGTSSRSLQGKSARPRGLQRGSTSRPTTALRKASMRSSIQSHLLCPGMLGRFAISAWQPKPPKSLRAPSDRKVLTRKARQI